MEVEVQIGSITRIFISLKNVNYIIIQINVDKNFVKIDIKWQTLKFNCKKYVFD